MTSKVLRCADIKSLKNRPTIRIGSDPISNLFSKESPEKKL